MNLKQAKDLRDEITEKTGAYCTVPLGHGPDKYFARIFRWNEETRATEPKDFISRQAWLLDFDCQQRRKAVTELQRINSSRPRSPIEIMIDEACGLD